MRGILNKIKYFILSHKKIAISVVLVIFLAVIFVNQNGKKELTYTVERGNLSLVIKATGNLKASENASLSFGRSGTVAKINFQAGDKVKAGEEIASLNLSFLYADLAKSKNALAEASVSSVRTIRETGDQYSIELKKAVSSITDAYNKEDNAIRNDLGKYFRDPNKAGAYFQLPGYETSFDGADLTGVNSMRYQVELGLVNLEKTIRGISLSTSPNDAFKIDEAFFVARKELSKAINLLETVASLINSLQNSSSSVDATLEGHKNNVAEIRATLATILVSLDSAITTWNTAPKYSNAGSLENSLVAESQLEQKKADVQSVEAQIRDSIIFSPLNGLITKKNISIGESATAGKEAFFVLADKDYYIEANVSEVNIGKVAIGNTVDITLDAYPDKKFSGKITYIESSETIVDGVVNYKIKVFGNIPSSITRSGLTANLSIQGDSRQNVLKIPLYALSKEESGYKAMIKNGTGTKKVSVETGFRASDGFVEVLSGLKVGDIVVLPEVVTK